MELIRELREIVELFIRSGPISYCNSHEAEIVKPAKQADHAGDVIRLIWPLVTLIHNRLFGVCFSSSMRQIYLPGAPGWHSGKLWKSLGSLELRTAIRLITASFLSFRTNNLHPGCRHAPKQNHGTEGAEEKNR